MLLAIKKKIDDLLTGNEEHPAGDREQAVKLATAALLAEVARADKVLDVRELATLRDSLREQFSLSEEETRLIVNEGISESEHSVSLQGFTRPLHEELNADEKSAIVDMLWRVAAADGELDKYEDALIAKIGELLYVPRSEVLRLKHANGL